MKIGAWHDGKNTAEFIVWGPSLKEVALCIKKPREQVISMHKNSTGYWRATLSDVPADGLRYLYRLNNDNERPDPASFYQPEGVHTPSELIDHHTFQWQDSLWHGIPLNQMVMYELHVGTFSPAGTFAGVIERLDDLRQTGVNAVEIMPVAQFPGNRNWGYDGVYPYAVQYSYGGPAGLKTLVNACHQKGMAVILDVVYNHMGPEGNYLRDFGPYFTKKYQTPWGDAVNFDDEYHEGVRNFFIENALFWFEQYHIDALRLDAIHGIYDHGSIHILRELAEKTAAYTKQHGGQRYLIAESDLNESRIVRRTVDGGYGLDAQWSDDFHHAVHVLLTGDKKGYYTDFGNLSDMEKAIRDRFVYDGRYSDYRKKQHGDKAQDLPADKFVVFTQNHDQIGNRMNGERLLALTDFERAKLAAAVMFLSPFIPLIFMGEEYGEKAPFLYFVSHGDTGLIEAVRNGRRKEFASFAWEGEPPDPQDPQTFFNSKLNWNLRNQEKHRVLHEFYRYLIELRASHPALACTGADTVNIGHLAGSDILRLERTYQNNRIVAFLSFQNKSALIEMSFTAGVWHKILDSTAPEWSGASGTLPAIMEGPAEYMVEPFSAAVFEKQED